MPTPAADGIFVDTNVWVNLLTDNLGDFARWGHVIDVQKL
jgi:hypothetical protein